MDLNPIHVCLLWRTRILNPNGISIGSAVFANLTAKRLYSLQWSALSPSKLPIPVGDLDPHLKHDSFGPSEPKTQGASRLVQLFLHSSPHSVIIFYKEPPLPVQNYPFPWGIWTPILWSPYGIGRPYIFSSCFFLLLFARLISAVGDWMSTILRHIVWS